MSQEVSCPSCGRALPLPAKVICPHCGAVFELHLHPPPQPIAQPAQPSVEPRFLVEEEALVNALVVDSEGYVCGRVYRTRYDRDEVFIDVYKLVEQRVTGPDFDRLKIELLKTLPKKLWKPRNFRDLEEKVRKELRLHPSAHVTDRELYEYAKLKGVPIPTKVIEHRDKKIVYSFSLKQIETVGVSGLGACVILKEPVEALKLSIQPVDKVPFKSTEQVKGKLTIDSVGKILGRAQKVLLGATLFLRVDLEDVISKHVIDLEALSSLGGFEALADKAASSLGIDRSSVTPEMVLEWARREGIHIPMKIERRVEKIGEIDVRWEDIKKIGDVVLLSKKMEDYGSPSKPSLPS